METPHLTLRLLESHTLRGKTLTLRRIWAEQEKRKIKKKTGLLCEHGMKPDSQVQASSHVNSR